MQDHPDPRSAGRFLQSFTGAHDAMEAAIAIGESARIEDARNRCLQILLDSFPPALH
jgi:hypothetical protein